MSSGFAYSPLTEEDGIRILLLQPAISRDEDLRGSLQHISLTRQYDDLIEPYTALSYVWGDLAPADKILLDHHELGITANLSAALRDLRDAGRTHRLWVDAVCIDQGNIAERNRQVMRMREIYSSANNTIIYLGPPDPYVDAIIEFARQRTHSNSLEMNGDSLVICGDRGSKRKTNSLLNAVHKGLLPNPWFRRIWVLQELVLSRVPWIQCGLKRVRWLDLCRLLVPQLQKQRRIQESQIFPADTVEEKKVVTALESMDNIRAGYYHEHPESGEPTERTLWQVLQSRKGCRVSDPRDIIYAHMGIISDRREAEELIRVDYGRDVVDVFIAMGRYVRYHGGFQAKLENRSAPSSLKTVLALPSWVPDLGVEVDARYLYSAASASPQRPAHVFPLTIWGGAEIIALSGILPAPSTLGYMKSHNSSMSWNYFVDNLPTTTQGIALDRVGLKSWPQEAIRLSGVPHHEKIVVYFRDAMVQYLQKYAKSDAGAARLALLQSGMVMLVPSEALLGDIVVVPVREWSWGTCALTVRPCESRAPTDLQDALRYVGEYENADTGRCWFRHASLVGTCAFVHGVAMSHGLAKVSYREVLYGWHMLGSQDEGLSKSRVLVLH